MQKIKFLLLLFLLLLISNCKNSTTEVDTQELIGTLWELEAFEIDSELIVPPKNQIYYIQFRADSTLIGQSDCNEIFGYYKVNSNYIEIDSLFTTKKGCGEDSMGSIYFEALYFAKSFKIDKNQLTIYYKTDSKLIFKED